MAIIALFHSVLGVRPGLLEFAEALRAAGHEVHVIDQNDGKVFDEYEPAMADMEKVGFPTLTAKAVEAVADLPDGFVTAGFSNGAGMAEFVAGRRPVSGVLMFAGAIGLEWLDMTWPPGVPAQIHTTIDDPWREQEAIDSVAQAVREAGGMIEVFDYPGSGHVFADSSKADENQPAEADLMMNRIKAFPRPHRRPRLVRAGTTTSS
jgi:dienelactone hydrolase